MKYAAFRTLLALSFLAPAASAAEPAAGLFVAVGYGGFRAWSIDGANWTAERWSEKNADDDNVIFSVAYRKGIFLCSGGGGGRGFILRSTDGKTWKEVAQNRFRITGVLALEKQFLTVFKDHFQTSEDGLTWKEHALAKLTAPDGRGGGYFRRWAVGGDTIVFGGDYSRDDGKPRVGYLAATKNGETPLVLQLQTSDVRGLQYANGRFVACTHDGQILVSKDGQSFRKVETIADTFDDNAVRVQDGQFYLFGRTTARRSADGESWTEVKNPPRIPRVVSPGGIAVNSSWGSIDFSDGKNWKKAKVNLDPTGVTDITWGVPLDAMPNK